MLTLPEPEVTSVDEQRLDVVDGVARQLSRFIHSVHSYGGHILPSDKDGVERSSYRLLAHLVVAGPARTTALAEALASDVSTVSKQTSALVKAGLLERKADSADGRACLLAPTEEGIRVFEHNRRARGLHLSRMLDDWDNGALDAFAETLERFNADAEQYRAVMTGHDGKTVGPPTHNGVSAGDHTDHSTQLTAEGETTS